MNEWMDGWKQFSLFNRFAQAAGPGLNAPSDEGKKGWRDEGEDRWKVEGRRHERMKGPMDERMKGRMDEWVQGRREKWIKGSRDEGKNVWKDEGKNRYMDVGRKGRTKGWKEKGIDPTSERKGPEQSNIDPRIYKKRVPKSTKMVPKSTQKGPKTKPRQTKNQSNVFKTILDPSGGRFSGYPLVVREPFGAHNRGKIRKKTDAKNRWFFDWSWKRKNEKKDPKTTPKWNPRWSEIEPRRKLKRKMGKV